MRADATATELQHQTCFSSARLEEIRAAFPILQRVCYLNTGTYGPMPQPALEVLLRATECLERDGVAAEYPFAQTAETVRSKLADLIHSRADEIAFTRNATDGINLALNGLTWSEGDVILTTDQEHEALWQPLLYLQARYGVVVHRLKVSPDPDQMRRRLSVHASEKVRLVAFSHVTCETGTRLPAAEMCRWAREHGAYSLVDIAQSAGVLRVSVQQLGCDMAAGNGHKWLHGPKGTGFFYARSELMRDLMPAAVGAGSFEMADWRSEAAQLHDTGARFEYGTRSYALMAGWQESLAWMEKVGYKSVCNHTVTMAGCLGAELQSRDKVHVLTPTDGPCRAALVSFTVDDHEAGDLGRALWQRCGIVTRHVPQWNALRVSAAHFISYEDIEHLMRSLAQIM